MVKEKLITTLMSECDLLKQGSRHLAIGYIMLFRVILFMQTFVIHNKKIMLHFPDHAPCLKVLNLVDICSLKYMCFYSFYSNILQV